MLCDLLLVTVALIGHFAICVWLYNRFHAYHVPRAFVFGFDRAMGLATILLTGTYAYRGLIGEKFIWDGSPLVGFDWLFVAHAACGITASILALPLWVWPRLIARSPRALLRDDVRIVDLRQSTAYRGPFTHGLKANFLASLPGNEILKLSIHTKEIEVPRWPKELDGLSIVQLSDLHMLGKLTQAFYAAVVQEAAALNGDMIVIAGDILEKEKCLPWIAETLGKLRAPLGRFYVLGNHELRLPDSARLRREMNSAGWIDVAGNTVELKWREMKFYLAGNERPWFGVEPQLPPSTEPRLLLAHTPDLFPWAKREQYDLMFAGHTHGGQIRLPLIGALISPSRYGFKYASGVFQEGPTIMHVSRGISGEHLLRWNCSPEITKLILRSPAATTRGPVPTAQTA